jgi:hypothetical protein
MARKLSPGKPAQFRHSGVHYFPFGAPPASALVLTSDPWSYLRAFLKGRLSKSRGENKIRFERALYYANLAEEFYRSAESAQLPAKATLAYYGVLNIAKCFICVSGKKLGDTIESHGLSPAQSGAADIQVSARARNHINIFHEFATCLGSAHPSREAVSLEQCISHIPEIHEVAYRLALLPDTKRNLLPVEVNVLVDDDETWLFTELCYWKKHEARLKTEKLHKGARAAYFRDPREEDGQVVYRCKRRKRFTWQNFERLFGNICNEYRALDIATLLTREGYRYYCDLNEPKYHHLAYSFMALFHLGTVTRYSPAKTESLLDGKYRPVIAEILALSPMQFVYQLTSHMTKSVCVVPFAKT